MTIRTMLAVLCLAPAIQAQPAAPKVELAFEDQFEKPQQTKNFRGHIVVLLYGDRVSVDANRKLGEQLHVRYHPDARGKSGAEAAQAPVIAVSGVEAGKAVPDVKVIPVACAGPVPGVVKTLIRNGIKDKSPDVPVWIDFADTLKNSIGMEAKQPNLAVIDARGYLRFKAGGELDQKTLDRLLVVIDALRKEAVE